ncbi:unnamed protein product [Porites lobata]|uniref:Kazal-like domain-containing protein n=1 Tax=Porites lobata TaxID=104759 RepID=A0ABN8PSL1_9CNID|nr:unnamed protein product [Porites lobata]
MADLWRLAFSFVFVLTAVLHKTLCVRHETFWGEKAPPGCQPCPKKSEGLFDTPVCGMNGIAYKNFCYLTLRNCIAKILKKPLVVPSKDPNTCGLQMKMYNGFNDKPFKRKKREIKVLRQRRGISSRV